MFVKINESDLFFETKICIKFNNVIKVLNPIKFNTYICMVLNFCCSINFTRFNYHIKFCAKYKMQVRNLNNIINLVVLYMTIVASAHTETRTHITIG